MIHFQVIKSQEIICVKCKGALEIERGWMKDIDGKGLKTLTLVHPHKCKKGKRK